MVEHDEDTTFPGLYRGIVTRNNDPEHKGRIVCQVPMVNGDGELDWALPAFPFVTGESGPVTPTVPRVGDAVWIMFEHGDVDFPVYIGTWLPGGR